MRPPAELPVVVGVDGSPASACALELAATEAALREVALLIVYVREPADRWHTVGRRPEATIDPESVVAEARQRALDRQPGLDVESCVVEGLPAVVLIDYSRAASVTVVGHQGGGLLGRVAGSVCRRLTTRGCGAIMVARGDGIAVPGETPVVLGMDIEDPAPRAIEFGFTAASARRVPLRAVYASRGGTVAGDRAALRLAEALARWSERYPDVKVECVTDHSLDPPAAILKTASDASLIVVGPHDQTAPRGLMLGQVGEALVHHAPCPVAVVHASAVA